MVAPAPTHVLPFLILHLDEGQKNLAGKTITFKHLALRAKVLSFGRVEKSIPYPSGQMQVANARVELEDTTGEVRDWFDAITPLRRLGEIVFEYEENKDLPDSDLDGPVPPDESDVAPEPDYEPLFTGEIIPGGVVFPPGKAILDLRDITSMWLDRVIPRLITRANFPNMVDDLGSAFSPIIFGRVESYSVTGVEKQGVINCPYVDTNLHRYNVARHTCFSVIAVYRKRPREQKFSVVSPSLYTIVTQAKTINGVAYTFTHIQFTAKQDDGTVIHADVSGINTRFDMGDGLTYSGEFRNPVDAIINLLLFALENEVNQEKMNRPSFSDTRVTFQVLEQLLDGAITDDPNQPAGSGITFGKALYQMCSDFGIDFFTSNHGKLTLRYYNPAVDSHINIDIGLTLRETMTPSIPDKIYNRLKYRYFRLNAGLTEFVASSSTGKWGYEETVDHAVDQDEMTNTGQNALMEDIVELNFVRDDVTALALMKRRLGYHTLRSYITEFEVPVPAVVGYLQLASCIDVTHYNGIAPSGVWTNYAMKVYGLSFDIKTLRCMTKAVRWVAVPDASIAASYPASRVAHAAQVRQPQLALTINDNTGDIAPTVDLNDIYPLPPSTVLTAPTSVGMSFTDGVTVTSPVDSETGFVNVMWQEDDTTYPRKVSGFVPIPNFRRGVRYYTGTLSPDTRPTGLGAEDIYGVIFYATDFDHEYFWVGTSETGTPSGWIAIEQSSGNIVHRIAAPNVIGYHLCDGATGIAISDYKGDVSTITLPNLTGSGGAYIKGAAAYTGVPVAASSPSITVSSTGSNHTHSGATVTVSNHTHSFGDVATAEAGAHSHSGSTASTSGSATLSGSTGSSSGHTHTAGDAGAHDHGGSTASDGNHTHSTAAGPSEVAGIDIAVAAHHHGLGSVVTADSSAATTSGADLSHTHTLGSLEGTISSSSSVGDSAADAPLTASTDGDTVDITGAATDSALGSHDHGMAHTHGMPVGAQTGDADGSAHLDQWAINVFVGSEDSEHLHAITGAPDHTHTIGTESGHTHTLSGSATLSATTTLSITDSGTHHHSLNGIVTTASGAAVIGVTFGSPDGSHSHTATADTAAEPRHLGLLPYMRL